MLLPLTSGPIGGHAFVEGRHPGLAARKNDAGSAYVTTGPLGSHFHQHHRGPGTRPQMFRVAPSRARINCPRWRAAPTLAPPDVEVPPDRRQSTICLTGEEQHYPGVAATASRPAVSRRHRRASSPGPAGGSLGTGDAADSGTLARRWRHAYRTLVANFKFYLTKNRVEPGGSIGDLRDEGGSRRSEILGMLLGDRIVSSRQRRGVRCTR